MKIINKVENLAFDKMEYIPEYRSSDDWWTGKDEENEGAIGYE